MNTKSNNVRMTLTGHSRSSAMVLINREYFLLVIMSVSTVSEMV